jgi:protein-L-isoaspartate(D-aspartate) O-methyltransferase
VAVQAIAGELPADALGFASISEASCRHNGRAVTIGGYALKRGGLRFGRPCRKRSSEIGERRMFDEVTARRMMVDGQVRTADVTDPALIATMLALPRERFLPPRLQPLAYLDSDIVIGKGRALLKPMVLAKLIQAAQILPTDRVLDVGCGTGYSSAVLSKLAGSVVALEEDADLAKAAKDAIAAVGITGVEVVIGPLTAGWPAGAPYDVIVLNGAAESLPQTFSQQLKPGGRLVAVYGRPPASKATIFRSIEGDLVGRPLFDASARILPGFAAAPTFVF